MNSLSREAEFAKVRRVSATVYAVCIDDYGWNFKTWEALADEDPFFHVRLQVTAGQTGTFWAGGKYQQSTVDAAGTLTALAPWLPTEEAIELSLLTGSAAPVVRSDWWLSRTLIQAGRKGTGYYDWLETKDRAGFDKVVSFDTKESQRIKKEVAGIVERSGVSNFPRQIFRFQALTGGYWQTRDVLDDNKDARDALLQLDGDFKHQAEEIYAFLPNGLFAYFLCDDKGVRQDSAPDKIGGDDTAPGRDKRIHVGLSCLRCHAGGLKPINDWGRDTFDGRIKLSSPDKDTLRRLRQVYLGELFKKVAGDDAANADAVKALTGKTAAAMAKAVAKEWKDYAEGDFFPADGARVWGLAEAEYLKRLEDYFLTNPLSNTVLSRHLAGKSIRSDSYEQLAPLVGPIVYQPGK